MVDNIKSVLTFVFSVLTVEMEQMNDEALTVHLLYAQRDTGLHSVRILLNTILNVYMSVKFAM